MRRAIARGRVFPQSYSTDRRYGRLSLKACALFPLMWANADDQGRLPGDPEEIKYACCPNIDHISKADTPELLEELDQNQLIKLYTTSKTRAIQILDWWDVHRPQWAWPSQYPPPEGWQDHLRYKKGAKEVVTENWFSQVSQEIDSGEQEVSTQVRENIPSGERISRDTSLHPGEDLLKDIIIWGPPITRDTEPRQSDHQFVLLFFKSMTPLGFDFNESNLGALVTDIIGKSHLTDFPSFPFHKVIETSFGLIQGSSFPNWGSLLSHIQSIPEMMQKCIILEQLIYIETEKETEEGKRKLKEEEERGNSPERQNSPQVRQPTPSPTTLPTEFEILDRLKQCFQREWGRVLAERPDEIIPRALTARESAQLRDLAKELYAAGGCLLKTIDEAFRHVAKYPDKMHVSYVADVLRAWLGIERNRSP